MQGRTHLVCGCMTGALIACLNIPVSVFGFISVLSGSLAPDIDTSSLISSPGRFFPFLPRFLRYIINSIARSAQIAFSTFSKHRGVTHAPIIPLLLLALSLYYAKHNVFLFSLGLITHLLLDFLTYEGIPLLYPMYTRNFSAKITKSGSVIDHILYWTFLISFLCLGYFSLSPTLQEQIQFLLKF